MTNKRSGKAAARRTSRGRLAGVAAGLGLCALFLVQLLRAPADAGPRHVDAGDGTRYRLHTGLGADSATPFRLVDAGGTPRALADFEGAVKLVFFGYTSCPDLCAGTLLAMREVKARLERDHGSVQGRFVGIFVTLDPARDTPQRLQRYVGHFDEDFVALTGTATEVEAAATVFDVRYRYQAPDDTGHYLVDHSTDGFLLGPRGRVWATYPDAADYRAMLKGASDLLVAEWPTR